MGRPPVLTELEKVFTEYSIAWSKFDFLFDTYDLRIAIKIFLDKKVCKGNQFTNNCHGADWFYGYLERHKKLSHRFACNIKKRYKTISVETAEGYIFNLEKELERVYKNKRIFFP